ncbi:MAG: PAS domain S-box protein [Nibricoccus sp.]
MSNTPEQLQPLSDRVTALIAFIGPDLRYRSCNLAYAKWFGLEREQLLGRPVKEVVGAEAWREIGPHLEAALRGESQEFEKDLISGPTGMRRQLHAVYTPQYDDSHHVIGVVALVTDTTARRQAEIELRKSEERFRAFVTTSSDVVFRLNADWSELRQVVGRDFIADTAKPDRAWLESYVVPEDRALVQAAVEKAIKTKSPFQLEHRVIRVDGSMGWISSRAIPLLDANGEIEEWLGTATDVTERRRAQVALRESEARYRSLFDSIDEGFCVIEMLFDGAGRPNDYRFIEVNPAFEKQAGMHEATGRRMLEFVSHIESHWLENYGRVATTGESIRFAAEYKSLNSWFDVYAFRIGPPAERKVAVLFNNITARKLSEIALIESEKRFRNMSDHSPMMLWVTDAEGCCTHLNERWYDYTGQTPQTGLGYGWLDAVHPDDRAKADNGFRSANSRRTPYKTEYRLRGRDGFYRWSMDAASPRFSHRGEFLGYIGSVIDIQERKESEEALRKSRERFDIVKDGAQVGFWFCDLPFDVLEWDNRVKEHFWLEPNDVVPVELFYERLHPDDLEATRRAINESIQNQKRYDIEYRTVQPGTGAIKWIRAIGRTFYDESGQPVRFDGVTLDVSEHKAAETALRAAKEQAERASRAKDDFLAQLSHELRTPLTPVLMTAESLREDRSLPAPVREQLEMISRNVALEARLIDDLLDLTRITHGRLSLRAETCDVHTLLKLVFEIVREEAREKSIDVSLETAATYSQIDGDTARLQQLFWNLLRNAVKFTPVGGRVCVRSYNSELAEAEGCALFVEVKDSGVGFESGGAEKLFAPFERGHAAQDPRYPGLGLGLAIARAIAELHGGLVTAKSAGPGQGATFTVQLAGAKIPIVTASGGDHGQPADVADSPLRLLIVEDHKPTRDVVVRLLRRNGHQVTPTGSVCEAMAAAEKGSFDAVISDLGLPDGTGVELMTQLRDRYGLKGIAVSGYGMDEDMKRTAEAGFIAHLVKPVDMKEVRRAIRQLAVTRKS